jgi:Golgi phosphoprotein 3 (GPP34)
VLIAEDLLLLLTDDAGGRLSVPAAQVDVALGGANLVELTLLNKVDLSGEGDQGRSGRIIVRDQSPTGDGVLDAALEVVVAHAGKKPVAVIRALSKNLRQILYERLAASGVVRAEEGRILGVFPTHRWPARDVRQEAEARELITGALMRRTAPDARTSALIALLHALRCEHKVVDARACGLSRRQLRERAAEMARGDWASEAVRRAIDEMMAAIILATTAAAAASSGAR